MSATRALAIAICAAAVLSVRPALAAPLTVQDDLIWGVNGHPLVSYPGVSTEEQLDYLRDMGLTSYRVDVSGTNHIPKLRRLVREAKKRGITMLPVVTPAFDFDKESAEVLEEKAYGLAFALVSSFKGDIPVWELGNELENYAILQPCEKMDDGTQYDCSYGPAGGVDPLDYYGPRWAKVSAVLKGLTEGAHAADPTVKRAVGTAGWGHTGAFERMHADGIKWEISIWHMYGDDPEWAFKKLAKYERPIWVTEFNNPLGSRKSEQEQVEGLMKTMKRLRALKAAYRVEAAHVYELMDEPYWGEDYEAFMGLVTMKKDENGQWTAGEPKPAYKAIRSLLAERIAPVAAKLSVQRQCTLKPPGETASVAVPVLVSYAYCLVLGREADGVGLQGWGERIRSDLTVAELLVQLMHSDEFAERYDARKLSPAAYATLIHRLLLGQDPDADALKTAVSDRKQYKRPADLQRALINSSAFRARHPAVFIKPGPAAVKVSAAKANTPMPELQRSCNVGVMSLPLQAERGQVIYSYCVVLGRWPDSIGLRTWTQDRRNGLTLEQFFVRLLESEEFADKYKLASLNNEQFVTLLYRLLFNRDPDGAGLSGYVSDLEAGELSRSEMFERLVYSDEFRNVQAALYSARMPARSRADLQN